MYQDLNQEEVDELVVRLWNNTDPENFTVIQKICDTLRECDRDEVVAGYNAVYDTNY